MDATGHLIAADVHGADIQDRDGAKMLLQQVTSLKRLKVILADAAYAGKLQTWFYRISKGKQLVIVRRPEIKNFVVVPKRWLVERFFGWINWDRRLAKDYEHNPATSRARLFLSDIRILMNRILRHKKQPEVLV